MVEPAPAPTIDIDWVRFRSPIAGSGVCTTVAIGDVVLLGASSTPVTVKLKVPPGTTMVLGAGAASATCTAARSVHLPVASAQMPWPSAVAEAGASVVEFTAKVAACAAAPIANKALQASHIAMRDWIIRVPMTVSLGI